MALSNKLRHHYFSNTALPYITNDSVVNTQPCYVDGNNVKTSIRGYAERRPGFPTYTADNFGGTTSIARFFTWQRWSGAYYVMLSLVDPTSVTSKVYKLKVGTDATFQLLHTDSTSAEPFDFVVSNNHVFFGNGVDMKKYDGTTLTNWGISPQPTTAPTPASVGAGNIPNAINHTWVYAYGNSNTGYVSDISQVSVTSQSITATGNRSFTATGPRCTDTQCDQIHVYRTEDGGSVYLELSNSPIANPGAGTWSITDNDSDETLQTAQAPLRGVNARPTVSKLGAFFQGRIWTFLGDTLYFSGYEEITAGTSQEENFPLPPNNTFTFGDEIIGIQATQLFLLVFCANKVWRISGDSVATFRRDLAWSRTGARNRAAITSIGNTVMWLDSSNTVRATNDGASFKELSLPIRPDIASITQASAQLSPYDDGVNHWVVLLDGGAGKLRVYDVDQAQWMPPWSLSGITAVAYGETAAGTYKLFIGRNTKPLAMSTATFQDEGASFTAYVVTGLMNIVEDANPAQLGDLEYVGIERNGIALSDVKYLMDEDPAGATFTSIFANEVGPAMRTNGTNLVEKWYYARTPAARRAAMRFEWAAANSNFSLLSIDLAYQVIA